MKIIYLLTGPKNSGKTTRLTKWINDQSNVVGIVCPREKGIRQLYSVFSKSYIEFEVDNENKPVEKIGKFKFLKKSFDWAENELLHSLKLKPNWIVIDEIGPLELQEKGFDRVTKKLLSSLELNATNLLLVVRDYLVEEVIQHYQIDNNKLKYADFI